MVIIGLLAGYVGPRYFAQIGKSEVKTTRALNDAFGKALDQYRLDTGRYPTSEKGLAALNARPENEPLKRADFPMKYEEFDGKAHYSEPRFMYVPAVPENQAGSRPAAAEKG